jgi:hypothetical protein
MDDPGGRIQSTATIRTHQWLRKMMIETEGMWMLQCIVRRYIALPVVADDKLPEFADENLPVPVQE